MLFFENYYNEKAKIKTFTLHILHKQETKIMNLTLMNLLLFIFHFEWIIKKLFLNLMFKILSLLKYKQACYGICFELCYSLILHTFFTLCVFSKVVYFCFIIDILLPKFESY